MKTLIQMAGILTALIISGASNAQTDLSPSDVIGKFAAVGYEGVKKYEKTMSEAHSFCMSDMSNSRKQYDGNIESDFYNAYRDCMKDYVPFRVEGQDGPGACDVSEVSWGQCSGSVGALADGQVTGISHTGDEDYQGHATFRCEEGQVKFQNGGCTAKLDACEAGQTVFWGVTAPLWADDTSSTVYLDRYGQPRHTPKASCGGELPSAQSGELITAKATVPETSPADRYNIASASSAQRCFNNEFIHEQQSNDVCEYIPRDCSATVYTHPNGCSYNIPAGTHDQIFTSNSPAPENSVGRLEAYCWDGEWEIKAATCTPSCEPTIPPYSWAADYGNATPSSPRQCTHSQVVQASRIPPSTDLRIDNETNGLNGEAIYTCRSGNLELTGEDCEPLSCEGIPANSWGSGDSCAHDDIDTTLLHGERLNIQQGTPFDGTGEIGYICEYGKLRTEYAICNPSPQCDSSLDESCFCDATPPPSPQPELCETGVTVTRGNTTYCCDTGSQSSTSCRALP